MRIGVAPPDDVLTLESETVPVTTAMPVGTARSEVTTT
jgi:hypothetical protein